MAEIAVRTWNRVVSQVSPVIGDDGVRVLYGRSLHLTKPAFPRFADLSSRQPHGSFNDLLPRFERLNAAEAIDFCSALLITFTELLAALIGEGLTARLTELAWADDGLPPDPTKPEISQ